MLQKMHEHIKGWIAAAVIFIISASFVLWGVQYYLSSEQGGDAAVAKVNGKKITEKEFTNAFQQLQRQAAANGEVLDEQTSQQLKFIALQQLIARSVIQQTAHEAGFRVSDEQVMQFIMSLPQLQEKGRFSQARFQQLLYASGLSRKQFFENLHNELVVNQMAAGIQASAFVMPDTIKNIYALLHQKRTFRYLIIPTKLFTNQATVTDKEIEAYYAQNKQSFSVPAQVSLSYIQLSPEKIAKSIKVSDEALKSYYQQNLSNYRTPQSWKVQRILVKVPANATAQQRVDAKQKIDKIAKASQVNFAQALKTNNGKIEVLSAQSLSPSTLAVLSELKPQQVSKVFQNKEGYNIVRLLAFTPAKTKPFVDIKAQVHKALVQQKVQAVLSQLNDKLADVTYTNPGSLEPAAKELNVQIESTPLFAREGLSKGIAADPKVVAAAFSDDVFKAGNNSNPIILKDGSVVVVRILKSEPRQTKPLALVRSDIRQRLLKQFAQAKAAVLANELVASLLKGQSIQAKLQKYALHWKQAQDVSRTDKDLSADILNLAFKLDMVKNMAMTALSDNDSAVVELKAVKKGDFANAADKDREALKKSLENFSAQAQYQFFVRSAVANSKIKRFSKESH